MSWPVAACTSPRREPPSPTGHRPSPAADSMEAPPTRQSDEAAALRVLNGAGGA